MDRKAIRHVLASLKAVIQNRLELVLVLSYQEAPCYHGSIYPLVIVYCHNAKIFPYATYANECSLMSNINLLEEQSKSEKI